MANNAFQLLRKEIETGMYGKNSTIPMGFHRLDKYVSIRKRIYTLVFAATGVGKSSFVHNSFILNPFDYWMAHKTTCPVKLKVILFSMERSKVYTLAKWVTRIIFLQTGRDIPIGKMLGWWKDNKLTTEEMDLIDTYEDYISELCEVVDIIEGATNPTGVYRYIKNYAEAHGKVEDVDEYHKTYLPDNEDMLVIPIVDHFGLLKLERGMAKKEAIEKCSEYWQNARDLYGYSPVAVMQQNRDLGNPIYTKMDSFEPTIDTVKESGRPSEDSDVVLSIFSPTRYKTNDPIYGDPGQFTDQLGNNYFRSVKILKSTYGQSDLSIGMAFDGATGSFYELPKKNEMDYFDYSSLFDRSYFIHQYNRLWKR